MPTPPVPQHCPSPAKLDDLELLTSQALGRFTAFNQPGSPVTLTLPEPVSTEAATAGAVELVDPEGLPLARVSWPGGEIAPLAHAQYGAFRRLILSPATYRQQHPGRTVVPVSDPITRDQLEELASLGPVTLLAFTGTGTSWLSPVGLARATLAAAQLLPDAVVVAVPLAAHGDPEADHALGVQVAQTYAAGDPIHALSSAATTPPPVEPVETPATHKPNDAHEPAAPPPVEPVETPATHKPNETIEPAAPALVEPVETPATPEPNETIEPAAPPPVEPVETPATPEPNETIEPAAPALVEPVETPAASQPNPSPRSAAAETPAATETYPPEIQAVIDHDRPPPDRQGLVVFFTGLSGSGKSTLARALVDLLLEQGERTVTSLDGDVVRRNLSAGLTFSKEDRETNIRRIGWVAAEISRHGGVAVVSPIAPFDATRQQVRAMVEDAGGAFFLVHVATPLDECERRDRKGLYARARAGAIPEFTGISSPYEEPQDADVRVDTTGRTIEDALGDVIAGLRDEGYVDLLTDLGRG